MRSMLRSVLMATSLLLLTFMTSAVRPGVGPSESIENQWKEYDDAVIDAAIYKRGNLHALHPLKFDSATMTETVVTLTNYDYSMGMQSVPLYLWVTAVPEVQQECRAFGESDLKLRLKQLLGLQPDAPNVKYFVTLHVGSGDIFRPATNPITTTEWPCDNPKNDDYCGEAFPNWVHDDYKAWIGHQMLTSYVLSTVHDLSYSYPWTRLGYTYDWNKGAAEQHYGASEYVIRPGAVVDVISKTPYATYCGRN